MKYFIDTDVLIQILNNKKPFSIFFDINSSLSKSDVYVTDLSIFELSLYHKSDFREYINNLRKKCLSLHIITLFYPDSTKNLNQLLYSPENFKDEKLYLSSKKELISLVSNYLSDLIQSLCVGMLEIYLIFLKDEYIKILPQSKKIGECVNNNGQEISGILQKKLSAFFSSEITLERYDSNIKSIYCKKIYYFLFMKLIELIEKLCSMNQFEPSFIEEKVIIGCIDEWTNQLLSEIKKIKICSLKSPNNNELQFINLFQCNKPENKQKLRQRKRIAKQYFKQVRVQFIQKTDYLEIFNNLAFDGIVSNNFPINNDFIDIYNIDTFVKNKINDCIYLTNDKKQYNEYINKSNEPYFNLTKEKIKTHIT